MKFVDFQNSLQKQTNHLKMQHRKSFPHFCLINGEVYFVNISKCSRYKHKKIPSNIFSNWKWCWDFSMKISPNSLWLADFAFFAFTLTNSPKISLNVDEKKKLTKNANINFDWMSFFWILTPKPSDSDKKKVYERRDGLFGGDQKCFFFLPKRNFKML